jgi:hypothetical protein
VSPVKYELGFYMLEDDSLHSHRREKVKSYLAYTGITQNRIQYVSQLKYELGFWYIPEDSILHSHRRENLKSYIALTAGLCSGDVMCLL